MESKAHIFILLIWSLFAVSAQAEDINYEVRMGATRSDNVGRRETNAIEDTLLFAGIGVNFVRQTRMTDLSFDVDTTFNHFVDDTFDDEIIGESQASFILEFLPDRIAWNTENQFGTLQTDILLADTADNRGTANRFRTGPVITIPLGVRTLMELNGAYATSSFEERITDNDELSGSVTLTRALSPVRSIYLSGTYADVSFDSELLSIQDYIQKAAFVGLDSEISSGVLNVNVGANQIEVLDETLDGIVLGVSFSREMSSRTTLTVGYDQRFSNSGDIFRRFSNGAREFGETLLAADNGEPFESRIASVGLSYVGDRSTLNFEIAYDDQDFESDSSLQRNDSVVRLNWSRNLSRYWEFRGLFSYRRANFEFFERRDDETLSVLTLRRNLNSVFSLDASYRYLDRASDSENNDFRENAITLSVVFQPR